jgi:hypothetical protein
MKKTSTLSEKIKAYSALAGSVVALAPAANAQINYTDINPDSVFTNPGNFDIDINNDAINDFQFNFIKQTATSTSSFYLSPSSQSYNYTRYTTNALRLTPLGTNGNAVLGSGAYPLALNLNDPISNSQSTWRTNTPIWVASFYSTFESSTYNGAGPYFSTSTSTFGNFINASNKYMGVRVIANTDTLYGWIRLDVGNNVTSYTVKDYAFQTCPGIPIKAGDMGNIKADTALMPIGADNGNNYNASDILCTFNKAVDETKVSEYRIFVVEASQAPLMTASFAKTIVPARYQKHIPNGANFNANLNASLLDTDGNPITNWVNYKIFVLSMHDGINATEPEISAGSPTFMLNPAVGIEESNKGNFKVYSFDKSIVIENKGTLTNTTYKVLDLSGKEIIKGNLTQTREEIQTTNLVNGVYLVQVSNEEGIKSFRVYLK